MAKKKVKEKIIDEIVEETPVIGETVEDESAIVEKMLGEKLKEIYDLSPSGVLHIEMLMEATGASYDEVAAEWHRIFGKGWVCSPQFLKY